MQAFGRRRSRRDAADPGTGDGPQRGGEGLGGREAKDVREGRQPAPGLRMGLPVKREAVQAASIGNQASTSPSAAASLPSAPGREADRVETTPERGDDGETQTRSPMAP
jgi:hypothetical protein